MICSEHWSKGFRSSLEDLPDRSTTKTYAESQSSYITPPRNITSAKRCLIDEGRTSREPRRELKKLNPVDPKDELIGTISQENSQLKRELSILKEKMKEKEKEMAKMVNELNGLNNDHMQYKNQLQSFQFEFERSRFTYEHIMKRGQCFYMTGLTDAEFHCLFDCIEPFLSCLVYPDCKSSDLCNRKMDTKTELMAFMTILRHSLHLGIMGWMTNTSIATQSRMFVAWSVFLVEVFERVGLTPLPGETEAFIPTEFINAGFGDTSCLGDCTETNILASENFDVNNITFSQYKNHTTGKTAVWITPQGSLLQCSDTYPGTISDNDITEQCGVLDMVNRGSVVLTDKGFGITDMCLQKGLHHNRPPLKFDAQYDESEISKSFDIATLRIYNENYIGRMRDWAIINACWPSSRIDLLGYVHKLLAHIVNIFKRPIGPKETEGKADNKPSSEQVAESQVLFF